MNNFKVPPPTKKVDIPEQELTERDKPAFVHLNVSSRGELKPINTYDNLLALGDFYNLEFRLNSMTYEPEVLSNKTANTVAQTSDQIHSMLVSMCNIHGLPAKTIDDHLKAICEKNTYHPVARWLDSGSWDGEPRLDRILAVLKTKDDVLTQQAFKHWLVGCVASLYEASFKSKLVPVLQGPQSFRKTAFIERIAKVCPFSFLEGAELNPDNKDSLLSCIRSWIVELGELERTNRNSQGSLKAFITRDCDTVRPPYARGDIKKPRQTHFFATVNGRDFLKDETGSSRFVVVEMLEPVDMDSLNEILGWSYSSSGRIELKKPELLKQFWLEVKQLYLNGFGWMLPDCLIAKAQLNNKPFSDKSNWYQYILEKYVTSSSDNTLWLTAAELIDKDRQMNGVNSRQIGKALTQLAEDGLIQCREERSRVKRYLIPIPVPKFPPPPILNV